MNFLPIKSYIQQHKTRGEVCDKLQTSFTQLKRWEELGAIVVGNRVFIPAANFKEK
jgi:hypothetical protein